MSGIDSLLEPLSKFCDHLLQPLGKKTPFFLQNTRDVLRLIEDTTNTYQIDLLVSLDVEALYTNIPQITTLEVLEKALRFEIWTVSTPVSFVVECATLALTENCP